MTPTPEANRAADVRAAMSGEPDTMTLPLQDISGRPVIYIINMQDGRMWGDCPMCNQWRKLDHAIAWCCGPTHDEIGSMSTKYRGHEVGGMPPGGFVEARQQLP